MSSPWLQTFELCRSYRRGPHEVRAVDGVNLTIDKGQFIGIVGASGSGKSTLLNLIAGLDTPTAGRIELEGTVLGEMTRRELSDHTALKNVELALLFNNTPRRDRRKRAAEALERLGLGDRMDHRPGDLSGGEQQRVAIARALAKQPEIIFADEPTGNLDHDNTRQTGELLAGLNREGLTIIMVTHDLDLAAQYAGRTIRMHYGALVDDLPPDGSREATR
jgi:putative ABC transport system ATP-binding protein